VRKVLRSGATCFEYTREVQPLPKLGPWRADLDRMLATNEAKSGTRAAGFKPPLLQPLPLSYA
jgi:hypothetical protein